MHQGSATFWAGALPERSHYRSTERAAVRTPTASMLVIVVPTSLSASSNRDEDDAHVEVLFDLGVPSGRPGLDDPPGGDSPPERVADGQTRTVRRTAVRFPHRTVQHLRTLNRQPDQATRREDASPPGQAGAGDSCGYPQDLPGDGHEVGTVAITYGDRVRRPLHRESTPR